MDNQEEFFEGVNKIVMVGHIATATHLNYLPDGSPCAEFLLRTERNTGSTKQKKRQYEYHRLRAYGRIGVIVHEYYKLNQKVYVEGRLTYESWDEKASRQKFANVIQVEEIQRINKNLVNSVTSEKSRGLNLEKITRESELNKNTLNKSLEMNTQGFSNVVAEEKAAKKNTNEKDMVDPFAYLEGYPLGDELVRNFETTNPTNAQAVVQQFKSEFPIQYRQCLNSYLEKIESLICLPPFWERDGRQGATAIVNNARKHFMVNQIQLPELLLFDVYILIIFDMVARMHRTTGIRSALAKAKGFEWIADLSKPT